MRLPFSTEKILAVTAVSIAFVTCVIGGISVSITNHDEQAGACRDKRVAAQGYPGN